MTKLTIPPMPEYHNMPHDVDEQEYLHGLLTKAQRWGTLGWQTAQREAALADELEEALERIKGHTSANVVPGTPAPDPLWVNFIATRALDKHTAARQMNKEARK